MYTFFAAVSLYNVCLNCQCTSDSDFLLSDTVHHIW